MTDASLSAAIDTAADWHAQIDAPGMDWGAFGAWLGADPSHRRVYDSVALLDAEIGALAPQIATRLPAAVSTRRWHWPTFGAGGAVAAGLAFLLIPSASETLQTYATEAGATRLVTLADGSHMQIDRGSRLSVSDHGAPLIELAQGAANFSVRHNPARTLVVHAGKYEIRDIGTRFDVVNVRGRITVAVAEGMVSIAARAGGSSVPISVGAGQRIDIDSAAGIATRTSVAPAAVADWSDGQLNYDDAPLPRVAADIARYAGAPLVVDRSAAALRFSGVLTIGDGPRLFDQIGAVLPIRVRRVRGVLHIERSRRR